jgi:two-component system chemotaxis response regulator CheY
MKILIAEDDRVSRIVLSELLTKSGHEVTAVENGQMAWDLYASQPMPMLISDWMMPSMDGLQLCRRIRAEKRAGYTYIILLTALLVRPTTEGMEAEPISS